MGCQPQMPGTQGGGQVERPEGVATLDYLRRLGDEVVSRSGECIKAVGMFGLDVHDKLLVLQELRPLLPAAVFFTNDMDAYFFHPSTAKYTKNLIVASSYSLSAGVGSHSNVHFRDQYQTATYTAVCRAIDDEIAGYRERKISNPPAEGVKQAHSASGDGGGAGASASPRNSVLYSEPRDADSRRLGSLKRTPELSPSGFRAVYEEEVKIFEVGVGRVIQLDRAKQEDPNAISVVDESGAGAVPVRDVVLALLGCVVILLGALKLGLYGVALRQVSERLAEYRKLLLVLSAAMVVPLLGVIPICMLVEFKADEPFSLFGGVSVWPTELLRYVAVVLAVVFGAAQLGQLLVDRNAVSLAFDEKIWGLKRRHGVCGISIASLVMAATFFGLDKVLCLLVDSPIVPARGDFARSVDTWMSWCADAAVLWLMSLVCLVNWRAIELVQSVHRGFAPEPQERASYDSKAVLTEQMPPRTHPEDRDIISHYMFAKKVAGFGGAGIYGPFIVLMILIMSRWQGFDGWSWPPALVAVMSLASLLVVWSSFALTAVARAFRDSVRVKLDKTILSLPAGPEDREKFLERVRRELLALESGAFAGLGSHPAVKALLIPTSGFGGLAVLNMLT